MPRNSQDDEKSSKDSKSPKNPNSSKKTSDAKKLTISTSGDEDYIPTTPTSSPGNHSNKLCDSFFFECDSQACSVPKSKKNRAAVDAGIEKDYLTVPQFRNLTPQIATRRSKKVSFVESNAGLQEKKTVTLGVAATPSTVASSNEAVTEGKSTGKSGKNKNLKTTIKARTEQWSKNSNPSEIVDLVGLNEIDKLEIDAPIVKKFKTSYPLTQTDIPTVPKKLKPKKTDNQIGLTEAVLIEKKKNDADLALVIDFDHLFQNPNLTRNERRKARYDQNLAQSKKIKRRIGEINRVPLGPTPGELRERNELTEQLSELKTMLSIDFQYSEAKNKTVENAEDILKTLRRERAEHLRLEAQARRAELDDEARERAEIHNLENLAAIRDQQRVDLAVNLRRVHDDRNRQKVQMRRVQMQALQDSLRAREHRLDRDRVRLAGRAERHQPRYEFVHGNRNELNHARNVQSDNKYVSIEELDFQKKESEKKLQEMLEENKKSTWTYKQKSKFQKKISRPEIDLAVETVIGSGNQATGGTCEKVSSEVILAKTEEKSGPLKRRHSLNLYYKHSNPDIKTINVCQFTITADVILMARSKNSNCDDVCIPLHKAQLLENVPYFKAMFANNWRENKVGSDSKSYGISDFVPENQEMDENIRDQASTSKQPPAVDNISLEETCNIQTESDKLSATISKSISNFSAEAQVLYFKSIYTSDIDLNQPSEDLLETFQLADFLNDAELLTHLEARIREMISPKTFSTMWQLKNETIRETCLEKLHLFAAVNTGTVLELEEHSSDMDNLMKSVYQNSDLDDILDFFNRTVSTIGFPVHMNYLVNLIDDRLVFEFCDKFESVEEFRNFVLGLQFEKVNESIGIFVYIEEYDQKDLKNHREWQIKFLKKVTMTFASFGENKVDSELIGRIFQEIDAVKNISWN